MAGQNSRGRAALWRPLLLAGFVLLALAIARGSAIPSAGPPPIHSAVLSWAEEHPGQPVPVIIQTAGSSDEVAAQVRASGGIVEREFHIIPALQAEVPAAALTSLAELPEVWWVSLDAPVQSTAEPIDASALSTVYPLAVNAPDAWDTATGEGVTVALVDTGVFDDAKEDFVDASGDLRVDWVSVNDTLDADEDGFGHGSHVGGIIAGYSTKTVPAGRYIGIAPEAQLLSVRVGDDEGDATLGDVMAGLQWVDDNRDAYDIEVVNLSLTSSVAQSYKVDPLDAAVELLWFHDIVVVVSAGNLGDSPDAVYYPPANDPFVITVGAVDDAGTALQADDKVTSWSSRGVTQDGFLKPDVVAPGRGLVSPISPASYLAQTYPERIVEQGNPAYFRLSGTSMAAGVVSGAAALVREAHPNWTAGQVKAAIFETARALPGKGQPKEILADQAVGYRGAPSDANAELSPSYLLLDAAGVAEADFDSIRWGSIRWGSIRWGSIRWDSIRWGSIRWDSIRWSSIRWGAKLND